MDELELKAAMKEAETKRDAMKAELNTAIAEQKAELTAKIEEAENLRKTMQTQLDAIATEQEKAKHTPTAKLKTFAQELREKLTAEAMQLKGMSEKKVKEIQMEFKSFIETHTDSVTTGDLIPAPQFEPGISKAPDRMPYLLDIISSGVANSLTIYYAQLKTRTDNSGWVVEGSIVKVGGGNVTQSVLGYETVAATMQNLLAFIKVSNNAVEDIDFLLSEVQSELLTLAALKLDAAILSGTVALNGFDGLLVVATQFAAGGKTLKAGVVPNNYDALKFAAGQIKAANFRPNYVVLNPADVMDLELERDSHGAYLFPPYLNVQPGFSGIRIIENTGMPAGTFLMGDFPKAKFWMRKNMELKIWEQNEDDAINQLKTITLYMRGTLVVKAADRLAFVTDTFADSIAEITLLGA